jgi:hypothetical protein
MHLNSMREVATLLAPMNDVVVYHLDMRGVENNTEFELLGYNEFCITFEFIKRYYESISDVDFDISLLPDLREMLWASLHDQSVILDFYGERVYEQNTYRWIVQLNEMLGLSSQERADSFSSYLQEAYINYVTMSPVKRQFLMGTLNEKKEILSRSFNMGYSEFAYAIHVSIIEQSGFSGPISIEKWRELSVESIEILRRYLWENGYKIPVHPDIRILFESQLFRTNPKSILNSIEDQNEVNALLVRLFNITSEFPQELLTDSSYKELLSNFVEEDFQELRDRYGFNESENFSDIQAS